MKAGKIIALIFDVLFVIIVLILAIFIIVPFFGWHLDAIMSGSMEPTIQVGALVVVSPTATSDIQNGDIIAFNRGSMGICHRVVEVVKNPQLHFITKGDNNRVIDEQPVQADEVMGKVFFNIPYAGYVTQYLKTPVGLVLVIVIGAALLITSELITRILKRRDD